jgi:hypothetical protein
MFEARECADSTKRVAAAVGEGAAAVRSVHDYLAFAHGEAVSIERPGSGHRPWRRG